MKELELSSAKTRQLVVLANDILAEAKRKGADQAAVTVSASKGFSVTTHDKEVEKVEYNQDKLIEIVVYFGKRLGSTSISDIRPEAVRAAVEAACHIAKFTDEDPASGLAEKNELAMHYPQLELAFPWDISVEKAIALAYECEREAVAYDERIMSAEEVEVGTGEVLHVYANSNGFCGFYPYTHHNISCALVAKSGEEMQREHSYTVAADPLMLESVHDIAKKAAKKTVDRLGARRLQTMKAPVIFAAEEARSLLGSLVAAISGGSLYRKASFLVDHLEKKIFPSFVHIQEHPHLNRALGSSPFDEDGVATRDNVFIEEGILKNYCLGVYSARKLGMKTTGNSGGIHNLKIKSGNHNLDALLKKMHKGLLITEMMGHGVNLITGDYSRGAAGFWIENGEIQFPVHEITVAGNLKNIYENVVEVGNDIDLRGNIHTGSILIEEMMIAGN